MGFPWPYQAQQKPQNKLLDTSLHSREKRYSSTHQNRDTSIPNLETLTSHSSNPTHREEPPNKEEPQTSSIQKGHPKHSNLNNTKRQRNTQQVKEHDKSPPNQNKEEIGSLPEKEFKIMIVKMSPNLENKIELQINSLEKGLRRCKKSLTRIKKK